MIFANLFKTKKGHQLNKKIKVGPKILRIDDLYVAKWGDRKYLFSSKAGERRTGFDFMFIEDGCWYDQDGKYAKDNKILKRALERFIKKEDEMKRAEKIQELFNESVMQNEI